MQQILGENGNKKGMEVDLCYGKGLHVNNIYLKQMYLDKSIQVAREREKMEIKSRIGFFVDRESC